MTNQLAYRFEFVNEAKLYRMYKLGAHAINRICETCEQITMRTIAICGAEPLIRGDEN